MASRLARAVFATAPGIERRIVSFRLGASLLLSVLAFVTRGRLPYWELVIGAFGAEFLANLPLLLLLRRNRTMIVAALGTGLDTILLLAFSNLVIAASAQQSKTSEFWLIYPLLIMMAAYRFRPLSSFLYALLLTLWYAAHIAVLFPPTSRPHVELPIRVGFFLLISALATGMAHALRRESRN